MKVTIVCGSQRLNSQSLKVTKFIQHRLIEQNLCDEADIMDLASDAKLPLWDEGIWNGEPAWQERLAPLSERLANSDSFVIIAPEYHGQAPAALKNFFLMWGQGQLAHKPALIVTVSSADGGAYPVAELRMSSYKNNRICYIPEQIIVRHVETVLNDDDSQNNPEADAYFRDRITFALGILQAYAKAMRTIRESGVTETSTYRFGM
ncbi:MAG: NADPH-dependent FMN reductase [bacterium]